MTALRKKLHTSRGATMLMALLLLLVAMMVSITLFTAAMTAYKTIRNDHESEQAVLTLSSAAELFRDAVMHTDCKTVFTSYYWDANYTNHIETQTQTQITGDLSDILEKMVTSLSQTQTTYTTACTVTAEGYAPVDVAFSAKRSQWENDSRVYTYSITAVFTGTFAGEERRMVLTMTGTPQMDTQTSGQLENNRYVKTDTFTLKWSDAQISRKER